MLICSYTLQTEGESYLNPFTIWVCHSFRCMNCSIKTCRVIHPSLCSVLLELPKPRKKCFNFKPLRFTCSSWCHQHVSLCDGFHFQPMSARSIFMIGLLIPAEIRGIRQKWKINAYFNSFDVNCSFLLHKLVQSTPTLFKQSTHHIKVTCIWTSICEGKIWLQLRTKIIHVRTLKISWIWQT